MYEDKFRAPARFFKYATILCAVFLFVSYPLSALNKRYDVPGRLQRNQATVAELAPKVTAAKETVAYGKKAALTIARDQRQPGQPMAPATVDALSRLVVMQVEAEAQLPQLEEKLQLAKQSLANDVRQEDDRVMISKLKLYSLIGLIVSALGFGISYLALRFVEGYRIL